MARIRYFAAAAEATGLDLDQRPEPTLGALRNALTDQYPALAGILPRCAVLVDGARADDETELADETLVDVLPPFAGG